MFERRQEKLAPVTVFIKRMAGALALAGILISCALFIGIGGYHWLAGLSWIDSLLEASMILGGMGPINSLKTTEAKIFASGFALFGGLVFIAIMGIILAPLTHRLLHRFHMDEEDMPK